MENLPSSGEGRGRVVYEEGDINPLELMRLKLEAAADPRSKEMVQTLKDEMGLDLDALARIILIQERRNKMPDGGRVSRSRGVRPKSQVVQSGRSNVHEPAAPSLPQAK